MSAFLEIWEAESGRICYLGGLSRDELAQMLSSDQPEWLIVRVVRGLEWLEGRRAWMMTGVMT